MKRLSLEAMDEQIRVLNKRLKLMELGLYFMVGLIAITLVLVFSVVI